MERGGAGEIITARYSYQPGTPPVADSGVALAEGRILQRGGRQDLLKAFPRFRHIHYAEQVLLPAYVNAHTHLELSNYPIWYQGPPPETFVDWILSLIQVKRGLGADAYPLSRQQGYQESIKAGTGFLGDIVTWSEPAHLEQPAGLRQRRFYELLGREGELFLARCGAVEPLLDSPDTGISPHAPYTLEPATLRHALAMAQERRIPAMIHLAESVAEIQIFDDGSGDIAERLYPQIRWSLDPSKTGSSPLQWVAAASESRNRIIMVHGVHLTDAEIATMGERQIPLVLCPRSNHTLRVGNPPVEKLLRAGVPLALGTDSRASAPSLSLRDEMVFCRKLWPVVDPDLWLQMATHRGGEILFPGEGAASLNPSAAASIQLVRLPSGLSAGDLTDFLCSDEAPPAPDHLYLQGRHVG